MGRKVDILSSSGDVPTLYRACDTQSANPCPDNSKKEYLLPIMRNLNKEANEGSSFHANLWAQSFVDAESEAEYYQGMLNSQNGSDDIPNNTALGRTDFAVVSCLD